jgi:hypothetical protein
MVKTFGRVCALLLVCWPLTALAQEAPPVGPGLLVSPTYVLLEGRTHSQALLLVNRGSTPQTYRISIVNRRQMADGQLVEAAQPAAGEGFAGTMVRYAPREIVLPPDKPQTVRLLVQMPATLPDGEYRSHILFQQVPTEAPSESAAAAVAPGVSVTIRAVFGVTIPLVLRKGSLAATASLSDLRLVHLSDEQPALALRLNRTGTRSIRGDLVAKLDGRPIGALKNVSVFLSTPYRELAIPLAQTDLKGHPISVTFAEDESIAGAASAAQTLAP